MPAFYLGKRRDGAISMLKSVHSTIRNLLKQISRQMPYTNLRGHPRTQGCSGSPINGILTGAARPVNTTRPSPAGFVWIGSINQLLHNHTLPDGSMDTPAFRTGASIMWQIALASACRTVTAANDYATAADLLVTRKARFHHGMSLPCCVARKILSSV